jgi:hypothetical protein
MSEETALVTGASSGIGYELTNCFAADGTDVVLVARREQRLEEIAADLEAQYDITATVIAMDLATPEGPRDLFADLESRDVAIETLVNNAGFGSYGRFDETDLDTELSMIDLNVKAVTSLTKLFVGPMVERGRGTVLNVASMAGIAPTPTQAVYSSTKAYILSFSEAIAHELAPEGITVTAVCPGPVDTAFFDQGDLDEAGIDDDSFNEPESVARAAYDGMQNGKRVVIPSTKMKALAQLKRALPRRRVVSMAGQTVTED